MTRRVADILADYLAGQLGSPCFVVTGGGAMHLDDALGHHPNLCCVFHHHEQACAMAAEGYARITNRPAVVCVTSGPGGTNAVTGVMGAWVDSIPMLVLSGQVKRETTLAACPEVALRQLGDQEFDIIGSVRNMTKYAVQIRNPEECLYHLKKALHLATTGRKGPVWLDIPLDVQGAAVEEAELLRFIPEEECDGKCASEAGTDEKKEAAAKGAAGSGKLRSMSAETAGDVCRQIQEAKAPVFLVGTGIHLAGAEETLLRVLEKFQIPVLTAWNANDLVAYDHPLFAGMPGTVGTRAGNFALQNADLLISIGCRMNIRMIGYTPFDFANNARKIAVDIDPEECKKPTVRIDVPIVGDAGNFLAALLAAPYEVQETHRPWLAWCQSRMKKYTARAEVERWRAENAIEQKGDAVNPYFFIEELFDVLPADERIVCGNGSACVVTFQAARVKQGQRMFTNSGSASMGYALPAAIGAALADPSRRVICIDGDGSAMMNLQELATVAKNALPIKYLILNNRGYLSMRQTQSKLFGGTLVGVGEESGVGFPDFEKIAEAFGLFYCRVREEGLVAERRNDDGGWKETALSEILKEDGPLLCEVLIDPTQEFVPKISSAIQPDGRILSPTLDDMSPFLTREEYEANRFSQKEEVHSETR